MDPETLAAIVSPITKTPQREIVASILNPNRQQRIIYDVLEGLGARLRVRLTSVSVRLRLTGIASVLNDAHARAWLGLPAIPINFASLRRTVQRMSSDGKGDVRRRLRKAYIPDLSGGWWIAPDSVERVLEMNETDPRLYLAPKYRTGGGRGIRSRRVRWFAELVIDNLLNTLLPQSMMLVGLHARRDIENMYTHVILRKVPVVPIVYNEMIRRAETLPKVLRDRLYIRRQRIVNKPAQPS
jgi:hypothetical protein